MKHIFLILLLISCGQSEPQNRRCPQCVQQPPTQPTNPTQPGPGSCSQITFIQLKPVLTNKCAGCHPGYDQYQTASSKIDSFINRVSLPDTDPRFMPKGGRILISEQQLFRAWRDGGLLQQCPPTGGNTGGTSTPVNYTLPQAEAAILNDLNQNPLTRDDFRYLVTQRALEPSVAAQAVAKVTNSLSLNAQLRAPVEIARGLFRINLRDLGLDANDWRVIESADLLSFESFTPNGQLIKQITRTRLPWMHVANFAFTSQQSRVYYQLLDIPNNLSQFLNLNFINVDFADQINNLETDLIGFNGSPISINKNRVLQRNVTPFGALWGTYDVFNVQGAGKNFFQTPLPPEINGSNVTFISDASEYIFTLPNGLLGFMLVDGVGNRVDAAPTNLVNDNEGLDPEIQNALDCHRCHYQGIINAVDQIRSAVSGNPSFVLRDQQIVDLLYTDNAQAIINGDNVRLTQAYRELGIVAQKDPLSTASDLLRTDYSLDKLASLALLSPEQLTQCISSSAVLGASIGQVIRGSTVTFEQVTVSFNDIKRECGLGREFL